MEASSSALHVHAVALAYTIQVTGDHASIRLSGLVAVGCDVQYQVDIDDSIPSTCGPSFSHFSIRSAFIFRFSAPLSALVIIT